MKYKYNELLEENIQEITEDDKTVKVSTNDSTPSTLNNKITGSNNISVSLNNPGSNETLDISVIPHPSFTDMSLSSYSGNLGKALIVGGSGTVLENRAKILSGVNNVYVKRDGTGDYTTIQDALLAVKDCFIQADADTVYNINLDLDTYPAQSDPNIKMIHGNGNKIKIVGTKSANQNITSITVTDSYSANFANTDWNTTTGVLTLGTHSFVVGDFVYVYGPGVISGPIGARGQIEKYHVFKIKTVTSTTVTLTSGVANTETALLIPTSIPTAGTYTIKKYLTTATVVVSGTLPTNCVGLGCFVSSNIMENNGVWECTQRLSDTQFKIEVSALQKTNLVAQGYVNFTTTISTTKSIFFAGGVKQWGGINNICIIGNKAFKTGTDKLAFACGTQNVSDDVGQGIITLGSTIGVLWMDDALVAANGGNIIANYVKAAFCYRFAYAETGGVISANYARFKSCFNHAVDLNTGSSFEMRSAIFYGACEGIWSAGMSSIFMESSTMDSAVNGYNSSNSGHILANNSICKNISSTAFGSVNGSTINASGSNVSYCDVAFSASNGSFMDVWGTVVSNCNINYSPAPGTQGNLYATMGNVS